MINIHRAAAYLNGDFPPYYRAPFNILTFAYEAIRLSHGIIKDSDLYAISNLGIKGKDMYRSILELLPISKQIDLLKLSIPEDIFHEIIGATMDTTYMPDCVGANDPPGRIRTTVTRDPKDPRKITSLHTKFLPTMNAYNTLVLKKDTSTERTAQKKAKPADLVVLPFEVRIGRSEDNIKAELLRLIPEEYDVDDLYIMISPVFE